MPEQGSPVSGQAGGWVSQTSFIVAPVVSSLETLRGSPCEGLQGLPITESEGKGASK